MVFDRASGEHVATLHGQFQPWRMGELLKTVGTTYGGAMLVVERNNHGHAVLQALDQLGYRFIYQGDDERPGWRSSRRCRC